MFVEFPVITDEISSFPLYIKAAGCHPKQHYIYREKNYENIQLLFCTKGKGLLNVEHKTYEITDRHVMFLNRHITHEYYPLTDDWTLYWFSFNGTFVESLFRQLNLKGHEVYKLNNTLGIEKDFYEIYEMLKSDNSRTHLECATKLMTLLMKLNHCTKLNAPTYNKTIREIHYDNILSIIENDYANDLSLDDISEMLQLTPYYISRLFKEYNQSNLITYLNQYRISMAKRKLIQVPFIPVKDIAKATGFNSSSYFSLMFKKSEGLTPLEFRQSFTD